MRSLALFRRSYAHKSTEEDEELKLPKMSSLVMILLSNMLMQVSFFVVVSSSNEYARHLGGTSTFSGVVIGVPTVFAGLTLLPLMKLDRGGYLIPLHLCCGSSIIGLVLYSLAYKADWLYLILIGRCVSGISFSMWMYDKRYVSDPRIVGIKRRTTLASWLIAGNGVGMCVGPFLGGVFYRYVGFNGKGNELWNGFTSASWVLAGIWVVYWVAVILWFEDIPQANNRYAASPEDQKDSHVPSRTTSDTSFTTSTDIGTPADVECSSSKSEGPTLAEDTFKLSIPQSGVAVCMCWFAMTCFFVLGAWEANIPVFAAKVSSLRFSPFGSGNFLALGALACFPFFMLAIVIARRVQDRYILITGTSLGMSGLFTFLALVTAAPRPTSMNDVPYVGGYAGVFMCWFTVALGFNIASIVTISLLSKQLPPTPKWNGRTSLAIQYSNYLGRVTGAIWGGSGVVVGIPGFVGLQIAFAGSGVVLAMVLWKHLKAKTG